MMGMTGGLVVGLLVGVLLLFGFAYAVWVLAMKEAGAMKAIGQVIAILIVATAVVMLFYGSLGGALGAPCGKSGRGGMMMGQGMMGSEMSGRGMAQQAIKMPDKDREEMMEEMMKHMPSRKVMMEYMKKYEDKAD